MTPYYADDAVTLYAGDCLDVLRELPDCSVDAVVTDPPAGIAFMSKSWDTDKGGREAWSAWLADVMREALRVTKPGGHALVWALPRTSHWTACGLEDAGWQIRDRVVHLFGSGFPKSLNLPGGRGTALKPAAEDWWLCRKPLTGTVAQNVTTHGTGALNIAACRVAATDKAKFPVGVVSDTEAVYGNGAGRYADRPRSEDSNPSGRWPANVVLDETAAAELGSEARFFPVFSEVCGGGSTRDASTSAGKREGSSADNSRTGGSGSKLTDLSPTGSKSTIEITTRSTTTPTTSCASPLSGTTTTISDCASSTNGSTEPNIDGASDATSGCHCPSITSGEPEHGRDTAARVSALTAASGSVPTETASTPSAALSALPVETTEFPRWKYEPKAPTAERPRIKGDGTANGNADFLGGSKRCRVCGCQTLIPPSSSPSCGHDDWERVPTVRADAGMVAHPTVKPLDLMRWLVRLVCPPGGVVLDPFLGSGTTAEACVVEGFRCIGVERDPDYLRLAVARLSKPIAPVLFGEDTA